MNNFQLLLWIIFSSHFVFWKFFDKNLKLKFFNQIVFFEIYKFQKKNRNFITHDKTFISYYTVNFQLWLCKFSSLTVNHFHLNFDWDQLLLWIIFILIFNQISSYFESFSFEFWLRSALILNHFHLNFDSDQLLLWIIFILIFNQISSYFESFWAQFSIRSALTWIIFILIENEISSDYE